jgi:hypothetical protein
MAIVNEMSVHSIAREHSDFAAIWPVLLFVAAGLALTVLAILAMHVAGVEYDPSVLQQAFP